MNSNNSSAAPSAVHGVNPQCADVEDWTQNCVPIGVALKDNEGAPWIRLTGEDLKILHLLLTKSLRLTGDDGRVTFMSAPLADNSPALKQLAQAAGGMAAWLASRG